jgi:hypothetical protein
MVCVHSYVERLLDRISNGVLPDDRRNAMAELQSVVAESRGAQLAFGAMGVCFFLILVFFFFELPLTYDKLLRLLLLQGFLYLWVS